MLLNYPETFELSSLKDKQGQVTWLGEVPRISEEYLVKREYVFDVPPLFKSFNAVKQELPLTMTLEYAKEHQALMRHNNETMQAIVDKSEQKTIAGDDQKKLTGKKAEGDNSGE